ncbi:hypothetical protein ABTE27_21605, partial [Acinetobacter baumannii]
MTASPSPDSATPWLTLSIRLRAGGFLLFFGLALAMGTRILLLLSITWVMRLTTDLFHLFGQGISGRDLILFFG